MPAHAVPAPLRGPTAERGRRAHRDRPSPHGKRLVIGLDGELFPVIHIMIAGRPYWKAADAKPPGKIGLAAHDPGGIEPLEVDLAAFREGGQANQGRAGRQGNVDAGAARPRARGNGHRRGLGNLSMIPLR